MNEITTEDGREAFAAIEAMSRENSTEDVIGFDREGVGRWLPWHAARRALSASAADRGPEGRARRRGWAIVVFSQHAEATAREIRRMEAHPIRSFVESSSDGDRPADLTDKEIADAAVVQPENRNGLRTPDGRELVCRVACYVLGDIDGTPRTPLEKHRDVHRALSGEDYATRYERIKRDGGRITEATATEAQTGPTIRGCKWCVSGQ